MRSTRDSAVEKQTTQLKNATKACTQHEEGLQIANKNMKRCSPLSVKCKLKPPNDTTVRPLGRLKWQHCGLLLTRTEFSDTTSHRRGGEHGSPRGDPGIPHPGVYSREMMTGAHAKSCSTSERVRPQSPRAGPSTRGGAHQPCGHARGRGSQTAGSHAGEFWPRALENRSVVARGRNGGGMTAKGQQRWFGGVCQNRWNVTQ